VTTSGATVDLLHDYAESEGAAMPDFTPATKAALLPLMQAGITPRNPLDVGIPSTMAIAADTCATAAADPTIDMVAWAAPMPRKAEGWGDVAPLRGLLSRTGKPIVAFSRVISQVSELQVAGQQAAGIPFLQGIVPTVRALNGLWFHAERRGRSPQSPSPSPSNLTPERLESTLARYGIDLARSEAVASAAEAAVAADRIGFPVALKIRSPDILHKTEAGGVALDLRDREAVMLAAEGLIAAARRTHPHAGVQGFTVQEMASGIEAILGARCDPLYGPLMLVGAGGILVELAKDTALRLLPVTAGDVERMIDELTLSRLLAGFRGAPAADRSALARAAVALGRFFLDHGARIKDIEINPLMVRAAGRGVVAVDVRVLWRSDGQG
jgi:acyl-CoA synthetase (NDP forming)